MSPEKIVVGFDSRLEKICILDMNDELKGYILFCQPTLDKHNRNIIIGSSMGTTHSRQNPQVSETLLGQRKFLPRFGINVRPATIGTKSINKELHVKTKRRGRRTTTK